MLSLFVCSLSNIFPRFSRWIPPGILHLCYVIVSRDNDNDGGANYSVEEEDDDITLRLSLVSADSRSHLCVFVPLEILWDYHEEDDEKI